MNYTKKISQSIPVLIIIQCTLFVVEGFLDKSYSSIIGNTQLGIDLFFALDIGLRIKARGKSFFKSSLNVIDFFLVLSSIVLFFGLSGNSVTLTVLRVFRLFRLLKIILLVPNSGHIVKGVIRSIKASRAIFVILSILIFFFSILGYLLFSEVLPAYFSDPVVSAYTVFTLFTVEGWQNIPTAVAEDSPYYYIIRLYIGIVIVFGSFFALSLANAIFIDEMVMDNNEELENKVDELKQLLDDQSNQIKLLVKLSEIKNLK